MRSSEFLANLSCFSWLFWDERGHNNKSIFLPKTVRHVRKDDFFMWELAIAFIEFNDPLQFLDSSGNCETHQTPSQLIEYHHLSAHKAAD